MRSPSKQLCGLLILGAIAVPTLSGCGNSEPTVAYAVVESGMAGTVFNGVKHQLDVTEEHEENERMEHETYAEETEHVEQREIEVHQAEDESGPAETGE
ncbi:MAG TPA: hypothetical protein VFW29_07910 [Solirubrobacteraceae bacterium]|nr:hypothetical protein [Solirubrobacteraceae bacterium]